MTRRLAYLKRQQTSSDISGSALHALNYAATNFDLTSLERSTLLIPDDSRPSILRPIDHTLYNNVGQNKSLLNRRAVAEKTNSEFFVAHPLVDEPLAKALKLKYLGLQFLHLQSLGHDMGVKPADIVRNTLEQYTERQFLFEFLANADDARASQFVLTVNDFTPSLDGETFMTLAMKELHNGPSVMVYNDKEFTQDDFVGICQTTIGSKKQKETIGQFGLGALTMFHITEVRQSNEDSGAPQNDLTYALLPVRYRILWFKRPLSRPFQNTSSGFPRCFKSFP